MSISLKKILRRTDYSSKNYYRRESIDKYKDLSAYLTLINNISDKNPRKVKTSISLLKNSRLEQINKADIIQCYGKPKYKLNKKDGQFRREVFFYKILLAGHKTRFNLHFVNNHLVYYSYTFSNIKRTDKGEILDAINAKYLNDIDLNIRNEYILDKNNCAISVVDNLSLTVNYICNVASDFFIAIASDEATKNRNLRSKNRNDLIDSL